MKRYAKRRFFVRVLDVVTATASSHSSLACGTVPDGQIFLPVRLPGIRYSAPDSSFDERCRITRRELTGTRRKPAVSAVPVFAASDARDREQNRRC